MKCAVTCGYAGPSERAIDPAVVTSWHVTKRPRAALVAQARGLADREGVSFAER